MKTGNNLKWKFTRTDVIQGGQTKQTGQYLVRLMVSALLRFHCKNNLPGMEEESLLGKIESSSKISLVCFSR